SLSVPTDAQYRRAPRAPFQRNDEAVRVTNMRATNARRWCTSARSFSTFLLRTYCKRAYARLLYSPAAAWE
ncbi:MAG: hypothetical protein V3R88_05095, partial [Alphaproteobacteria bacterium]